MSAYCVWVSSGFPGDGLHQRSTVASCVAVLGGASGVGAALADGLGDAGCSVAVADNESVLSARSTGPTAVGCEFSSANDIAEALEKARQILGSLHAVVDARVPSAATVPRPLATLDVARWAEQAEEPMRQALRALQAAHQALNERGGAIVIVIPTLAMTGASGMVPWTTAAEGCRSLAKAAARAWGSLGVRVNCLALAADSLAGSAIPLDRPGLSAPALGGADVRRDAGAVLAALTSDGMRSVTGLTVAVDGGVWMTP